MGTSKSATQPEQKKRPVSSRQMPEGQISEKRQPEYSAESNSSLQRYFGNSYMQALATTNGTEQQLQTAHPSALAILHSPGQPLDLATRAFMELRFGYDFSRVRIYTDAKAAESAAALKANAYTFGHRVIFAQGRFDTKSERGQRLIAHELAHTIQQRGSEKAPFDTLHSREHQADHAADQVLDGSTVSLLTQSGPVVACQRSGESLSDSAFPTQNTNWEEEADQALAILDCTQPVSVRDLLLKDDERIFLLLGPFGYVGVQFRLNERDTYSFDIGAMMSSFKAAMDRWRKADRRTRRALRLQGAIRVPTDVEIEMRENAVAEEELEDGRVVVSPLWARRKERNYALGNVTVQKMDALVNGGPVSLLGRVEGSIVAALAGHDVQAGGEIGADIGSLGDVVLPVQAGLKRRADMRGRASSSSATKVTLPTTPVPKVAPRITPAQNPASPEPASMTPTLADPTPPISPIRPASPSSPTTLNGLRAWAFGVKMKLMIEGVESTGVAPRIGTGGSPVASRPVPALVEPSLVTTSSRGPAITSDLPTAPGRVVQAPTREAPTSPAVSEPTAETQSRTLSTSVTQIPSKASLAPSGIYTDTSATPATGVVPRPHDPLQANLDHSFQQTFDQADPQLPSGASMTQAPEILAGFDPQHIVPLRRLLGRPLNDIRINDLARIWNRVARPGQAQNLTMQNSRRLFDNHRTRFWRAVRQDVAARQLFTDAGFAFGDNPTSAPTRQLANGDIFQATIDHIVERQSNPARTLDPSNLRISSRRENSVVLRQVTDQDPFQ